MHTLTSVYQLARHVDSLSDLYIILTVFEHDVRFTIHLDCRDKSKFCLIACCMTTLLLLDYMLLVYVGRTSIPPTSKSLGFGHSFHLSSHYCKCETFCVLAL